MRELTPELRAVSDLARSAQGAYEVPKLLDRICACVADIFGFERVGISRYLPHVEEIEPVSVYGLPFDAVASLPRSLSEWPYLKRAIESGDVLLIEDVRDDRAMPPDVIATLGVRSVLALPLMAGARCLGVLSADRGGERFSLDEPTVDILTTIGVLAASFLERALVYDELVDLDKLKSNFIALASHELRTPAAVIYGISTTLHRRGDELRPEQLVDLRTALYEQSDRMRQLVDQLLDLSRLEANAIKIRPERFGVRRRVEDLVLMTVGERAVDIAVDVPLELEALADPHAFDRIVSNLITNACRYGEPPITVAAEQRDRHFRLTVEDRGAGVAPKFAPRLFERFTRSDTSATKGVGAGLGLSIAQSFAHAHGGDLLYHPVSPHGAQFELVLPRPQAG